ncbi:hypothetical protein BDQ17DRAFT_1172371, partial [Cyathus striatus]
EELLIDFQEMLGKHTGKNMASVIWKTLQIYGLDSSSKILAFVMDNATNNDTMLASL